MNESHATFCFYVAGTLLMLMVLNFFLLEKVTSVPMRAILAGHGMMSLKDLLDHVITLSCNITELTAETQRIFVSTSITFGSFTKWNTKLTDSESYSLLGSVLQQNYITNAYITKKRKIRERLEISKKIERAELFGSLAGGGWYGFEKTTELMCKN